MTGCWEHTSLIWAPLKDTRSKGRSLSIIWLDLANSYRSVPQVLILFALRRYKIPEDWITLVITFYNRHWGRGGGGISNWGVSSDWHRCEKGIFARCNISVILSLAVCNVILEYSTVNSINQKINASATCIHWWCKFDDNLNSNF